MKIKMLTFFFCFFTMASVSWAESHGRYFLEGDGTLSLKNSKTEAGGTFAYRHSDNTYNFTAISQIEKAFNLKKNPGEFIHPRLIALLDYLQDRLKGGMIKITSGYRSPTYNEGLRKKGKLAAKTSMHIEGMAADMEIDGVDGKTLWDFVRTRDCCGAGYYQGKGIHVDVGPSRFWDEKTTGVEKDLGARNKLVLLRTYFDYYSPDEKVDAVLGRITDYPIGIHSKAKLETSTGKEIAKLKWNSENFEEEKKCVMIPNRQSARSLSFYLPKKIRSNEKLAIRIEFCNKPVPEMPDSILSNVIQIQK